MMSLTQEAVESHNAQNRRNSKGGEKSSKKTKRSNVEAEAVFEPTITITNADSLVVSDSTAFPDQSSKRRRVTMEGTSMEALNMFLLEDEDSVAASVPASPAVVHRHDENEDDQDGGESVVAFDNSIFDDTVSQISMATYQTELENEEREATERLGALSEIEEEGEENDDEASFGEFTSYF
jgi:hypothetical protein